MGRPDPSSRQKPVRKRRRSSPWRTCVRLPSPGSDGSGPLRQRAVCASPCGFRGHGLRRDGSPRRARGKGEDAPWHRCFLSGRGGDAGNRTRVREGVGGSSTCVAAMVWLATGPSASFRAATGLTRPVGSPRYRDGATFPQGGVTTEIRQSLRHQAVFTSGPCLANRGDVRSRTGRTVRPQFDGACIYVASGSTARRPAFAIPRRNLSSPDRRSVSDIHRGEYR